jgi:nicotinamide riboside transporter PnuC
MSTNTENYTQAPVGQLSLWFGILGGPTAWFAHLVIAYSLVPVACARGLEIVLYLVIPAMILIAAAAGFFAWRGWRLASDGEEKNNNGRKLVFDRVRFMALSGIVMSAFFLVVIIAQSVPILAYGPCDPAGSIRI